MQLTHVLASLTAVSGVYGNLVSEAEDLLDIGLAEASKAVSKVETEAASHRPQPRWEWQSEVADITADVGALVASITAEAIPWMTSVAADAGAEYSSFTSGIGAEASSHRPRRRWEWESEVAEITADVGALVASITAEALPWVTSVTSVTAEPAAEASSHRPHARWLWESEVAEITADVGALVASITSDAIPLVTSIAADAGAGNSSLKSEVASKVNAEASAHRPRWLWRSEVSNITADVDALVASITSEGILQVTSILSDVSPEFSSLTSEAGPIITSALHIAGAEFTSITSEAGPVITSLATRIISDIAAASSVAGVAISDLTFEIGERMSSEESRVSTRQHQRDIMTPASQITTPAPSTPSALNT